MAYLRRLQRAHLLFNLQQELLTHHANLQRALDGTAMSYVPTSGQRENIVVEQTRLISMLVGVHDLTEIWGVKPAPGRFSSPRLRRKLVKDAHEAVAADLAKRARSDGSHTGYAEADLNGLANVLHYMDTNIGRKDDTGSLYPQYASIEAAIGYGVPKTTTVDQADTAQR
jgi:hypothetical protein